MASLQHMASGVIQSGNLASITDLDKDKETVGAGPDPAGNVDQVDASFAHSATANEAPMANKQIQMAVIAKNRQA